ncbi:MAG: hypothetical protein ACK56I_20430, partial [bacterium]
MGQAVVGVEGGVAITGGPRVSLGNFGLESALLVKGLLLGAHQHFEALLARRVSVQLLDAVR